MVARRVRERRAASARASDCIKDASRAPVRSGKSSVNAKSRDAPSSRPLAVVRQRVRSIRPRRRRGLQIQVGCGIVHLAIPRLLALDNTARTLGRIVDLPSQSAPSTPSLHPGGKAIVFALTPQPDPKRGFGSDLYVVNVDGTGLRAVVQHESDNVFYASPRFDASGNVIYFHRRAAIITMARHGQHDAIERLDLRSGEGSDREGPRRPTSSPDGKTLITCTQSGQVDAAGAPTSMERTRGPSSSRGHLLVPTGAQVLSERLTDRVLGGRPHRRARQQLDGKLAHSACPRTSSSSRAWDPPQSIGQTEMTSCRPGRRWAEDRLRRPGGSSCST